MLIVLVMQYATTKNDVFVQNLTSEMTADVNPCEATVCGPNEQCMLVNQEAKCICRTGYTGTNLGCVDIDECAGNPCQLGAVCKNEPVCKNLPGSYDCQCPPGFNGNPFLECLECNSPDCRCQPPYKLTDGNCVLASCGDDGSCPNGAECITITGGVSYCACPKGFKTALDGSCTDINECIEGQQVCGYGAECVNSIGSYECHCPRGYSGEPYNGLCSPAQKRCISDSECSANERCVQPGECVCPPPFFTDPQDNNKLCVANNHVAQCQCPPGSFVGDPSDPNAGCKSVPCVYNIDCPPSQLCNRMTHTCYDKIIKLRVNVLQVTVQTLSLKLNVFLLKFVLLVLVIAQQFVKVLASVIPANLKVPADQTQFVPVKNTKPSVNVQKISKGIQHQTKDAFVYHQYLMKLPVNVLPKLVKTLFITVFQLSASTTMIVLKIKHASILALCPMPVVKKLTVVQLTMWACVRVKQELLETHTWVVFKFNIAQLTISVLQDPNVVPLNQFHVDKPQTVLPILTVTAIYADNVKLIITSSNVVAHQASLETEKLNVSDSNLYLWYQFRSKSDTKNRMRKSTSPAL
ncbi:EGF CA domain containing protein [Asbolus verrucosus]|uniref:EGF CA domain containing protein n=1 Tax=Asbolus verrucosus TaxID=1661398 RepID=A0A482VTW2_ASBVE|nr:EGF CA domain containing protein [Asbolus verrucosus]